MKKIITEKFNLDYSIDNVDKEAIETVLNLIEKQQKEIEELKSKVKSRDKQIECLWLNTLTTAGKCFRELLDKYIPKSKIEEKIKELENREKSLKELLEED